MPDTDFFSVGEDEQIRRIALLFDKHPEFAAVCSPAALVMNGLAPGDFDLTADGDLIAVTEAAQMMVDAGREIEAITGGQPS